MLVTAALLILDLFARYPHPDDCWDVLEINSYEFEDQARAELTFCLVRFRRQFARRRGDSFRTPCWEARDWLGDGEAARKVAEQTGLTLKDIRRVATDTLDKDACKYTRGEELVRAFEREHREQVAIYECMNAEDRVNYGPLGMGPYRKKDVDLDCWHGGHVKFLEDDDGN